MLKEFGQPRDGGLYANLNKDALLSGFAWFRPGLDPTFCFSSSESGWAALLKLESCERCLVLGPKMICRSFATRSKGCERELRMLYYAR